MQHYFEDKDNYSAKARRIRALKELKDEFVKIEKKLDWIPSQSFAESD